MTGAKTNPYPTLTEMGVDSPKQIDRFYVSSINFVDVLRIVYVRPKGSFRASSRTYKFARVKDNDANLSTHPKLRSAVEELRKILEAKSTKESLAAEILSEIELLEEDIAMRSECLKALARQIPVVG